MKKITWVLFSALLWIMPISAQQVSIVDSFNAQQLVEDNLVEGCVEISNISSPVNGNVNGFASYGYFERAGSNFPFESGIVLSTGNVSSGGNVINGAILNEGELNWGTDSDLEAATGVNNLFNATAIQFDFVSVTNQIQFNYILASEEYFANFPCLYSDGFAFLIREAGTNNPWQNIALVPGTTVPVNTSTVHDEIPGFCAAENQQFFDGYNMGDTNFNGRTEVLTATAVVIPNVSYTIKLVIADQTDENYDSAVFIEGKSFNATVDLGEDITTCASNVTIDANLQNSTGTFSWYFNNVLIPGANSSSLNVSQSGNYRVVVEIPVSGSLCPIEDNININLSSTQPAGQIPALNICDDAANDGVAFFDLSTHNTAVLSAVPPGNYGISYHYSNADAVNDVNPILGQIQNVSNPQTIYVRIEDTDNGCLAFSDFEMIVNAQPIANAPAEIDICDDDADGITSINLSILNNQIINGQTNTAVTYHYTPADADTGNNPIPMPYVNSTQNEQVYIRLENTITGCYDRTSLIIRVTPLPDINLEPIFIDACDADFDGFATFDLTQVTDDILNGLTGVTLTFHESYADAFAGSNAITDPANYVNILIDQQVIYVRVEDDATGCFAVREIEIHTNLLLTQTLNAQFAQCDTNNDGVEAFNLSDIALEIVNGLQNVNISFHLTEADRDNNVNPLDPVVPFFPTSNPQTLWIRIQSLDCLILENIELILTPVTEFGSIGSIDYCDDNADGFTTIDLREFDNQILNGFFGFTVEYYATLADAQNAENTLGNFYDNIANPQTLYYSVTEDLTGCSSINSFEITITPSPEAIDLGEQYICDNDDDEIVVVNLEDYVPQITNSTNVDIDFFLFRNAAENNIDPIPNPSSFSTSGQDIFVRVGNSNNGCYNIAEFSIVVNTLPIVYPIEDYLICNALNTGTGNFVFSTKDAEILNGQSDKEVLYFTSQVDADNRTNSIDKFNAYQNISNPQTIFVRIENDDDFSCYSTSSFDIEVGSTPNYNAPTNTFICDDISNDGIGTFDFNETIAEIQNGINENLTITFHSTLNGAENGNAPLPLNYVNTSNPQQIYVRITNGTACFAITDFEVNVIQVPEIRQNEVTFSQCDINYDGQVSWDLTEAEFEILDVRQDNITISYHESLTDAENDTNLIFDPENYTNVSNPQTVYIRINNVLSNCFVIIPINLIVELPPQINDFEQIEICDNENNYYNLGNVNSIIANTANDIAFSYHTSLEDAQQGTNDLSLDYTYQSPNDTIYARVMFETSGCAAVYEFQLLVNPIPVADNVEPLQVCDDESNDNTETVDLLIHNAAILGVLDPFEYSVSYYETATNATMGVDVLSNIYTVSHNQTLYYRLEDNRTSCFSTGSFNVIFRPHPSLNEPLVTCDDNYDGVSNLDLTQKEAQIAATTTGNISFSYFESLEELLDGSGAIANPEAYSNFANPQTLFIKVFNLDANCYSVVPLEIQVNLPPLISNLTDYNACSTPTETILLSDITNELLIDTGPDVLINYYLSEEDALNEVNSLPTNYSYTQGYFSLYARVKFASTQCTNIAQINVTINEVPVAYSAPDLEDCDDDLDGMGQYDLGIQTPFIIGNQNADELLVTYYKSLNDAQLGENMLDETYLGAPNEVIYARLENVTTLCFDISQFTLILHPPRPTTDLTDQALCNGEPIFVDAYTGNSNDSYVWSTGATTSGINIEEPGTYWVTITTPYGCQSTAEFTVTESEPATIIFTEIVDFSDNNSITIEVEGIGDYVYSLDGGEPQESNVFNNVSLGYHTVTIIDLNGCAEVTKDVLVIDIPKFFTPNNDGAFDTWHIVGVETLPGTVVKIFDRMGKHLETLNYTSEGWDGNYNGLRLPAADYWFVADIKRDNIEFQVKGHFALRR
jgi:gliding motility-associated-like protein